MKIGSVLALTCAVILITLPVQAGQWYADGGQYYGGMHREFGGGRHFGGMHREFGEGQRHQGFHGGWGGQRFYRGDRYDNRHED